MNQQQLLEFLILQGARWVHDQRAGHRPAARSLSFEESSRLELFIHPDVLAIVRVRSVPIIVNPPFYADLAREGIEIPLDFRQMSGITFQDTILISQAAGVPESQSIQLIFHEIVHILQYRELGVEEFIRRYVLGWAAAGFNYAAIPLERDAYELDARFGGAPSRPFDVELEVRRRLASTGAAA